MECETCEKSDGWIRFAPQTMDMLRGDASDSLWTVISTYDESRYTAIWNLMKHLDSTHLFQLTANLLTLISPNECMSAYRLQEAIARAWFQTNLRSIMEKTWVRPKNAFRHVFIGEKFLSAVSGLHHGGRVFLLHANSNLQVTSVLKGHNVHKIITFSFLWDGICKRLSTVFFGLPVEFEVFLYFICYVQSRTDRFHLLLDQSELTIMVSGKGDRLCTAYFKI